MLTREMTESDIEGLKRLAARCPVGGKLAFRSDPPAGALPPIRGEMVTVVCEDEGVIVGSYSCLIDVARVNGVFVKYSFGSGTRVDPSYRGTGVARRLLLATDDCIRSRGAVLRYGFVNPMNTAMMRFVAKSGFSHVADRVIWGVPVLRQRATHRSAPVRSLRRDDLPSLVDLINQFYADYDFFLPWDADRLASETSRMPGFHLNDVLVAERNGRLTACLGVWNMGEWMRVHVVRLSPKLRVLKGMVAVMSTVAPVPRVPGSGEELKHYVAFPVAYTSPEDMTELFNRVHNRALRDGVPLITVPASADEALPFLPRLLKVGFHSIVIAKHLSGQRIPPIGKMYMCPAEF